MQHPSPHLLSPSAGPYQQRPRSQTLSNTPLSPQSYRQPLGSGSLSHKRSGSVLSAHGGAGGSERGVGEGKRRAVFCDVVLDQLTKDEEGEWIIPTTILSLLDSLGSTLSSSSSQPPTNPISRPSTPQKAPTVDMGKVQQHLRELWTTEESYHRKIKSLCNDFALPLREFARKPNTAIIPTFQAKHLFANIEELVPISERFEIDLREVINQMNDPGLGLPEDFGEILLHHIHQFNPFRKWLASVSQSEAIYRSLAKSNSDFNAFIDRTQIRSRETTKSTSGFKELLAEPFQRVSRYRLMIDPIIRHLPPGDRNIEPLEEAVEMLSDICNMQVDEATKRTAAMWSLKETIEGFPPTMVHFDRHFIDCIDVDEIVDSPTSSSTTILRCTLFLFSDKLLIAKRPAGDKNGRQHAGLDNIDNLAILYATSNLSSTQSSLLGSPKKLKKGVMGFRGLLDLPEVVPIDFGGPYMGLVLTNPPFDQSERWNGRLARRYVVASTYPVDVRQAEKEVFLNHLAETVCLLKGAKGFAMSRKSAKIWEDGSNVDSTVIYWSICEKDDWVNERMGKRGQLALHLEENADGHELEFGSVSGPSVVARATLLSENMCRFSVRSRDSSTRATETIDWKRIPSAVAEIGASSGHFDFPAYRPTTPTSSVRSRPKSLLLSAAFDVFGSANSLKRHKSTTSKTSDTTSASRSSWGASSTGTSTPHMGSLSPSHSPIKSSKKVSPVWYGSHAGATRSVPDLGNGGRDSRMDTSDLSGMDDDEDEEVELIYSAIKQRQTPTSLHPSAAHRRRHSSLPPPPQPQFRSGSPAHSVTRETTPEPTSTLRSHSLSPFNTTRPTTSLLTPGGLPLPPPDLFSTTSGLTTPRRRVQGPRLMGKTSATSPMGTGPAPFARDSPPPLNVESERTLQRTSSRPTSISSQTKRQRSLVEASPRTTPAKKVLGISEGLSRGSMNQTRPRIPSGSLASRNVSARKPRRLTSGASTIRGDSPPLPAAPSRETSRPESIMTIPDDPEYSNLERLKMHIINLRTKLGRELQMKENERSTAAGLSRSPNFRNLQSNTASIRQPPSSDAHNKSSFDASSIIRWADRLNELVSSIEAEISISASNTAPSPSISLPAGPSQAELDTVIVERDMMMEDVADLRVQLGKVTTESSQRTDQLAAAAQEILTLKTMSRESCTEVARLYDNFEEDLDGIFTLVNEGTEAELTQALHATISQRNTVQKELASVSRELELEKFEKERWRQILLDNGLIPRL